MDRSHQDSPLPWKQPSPLLQVPQDFSNPTAAYHIDIFRTFHKGLIGDFCSNSIATQLRGWLFIFYIFSFNCWYLASLNFCLDFACPHHSLIWGSVVWPQDWQPVNFLWFGRHFFRGSWFCQAPFLAIAYDAIDEAHYWIWKFMVISYSVSWPNPKLLQYMFVLLACLCSIDFDLDYLHPFAC